MKPSTRSRLRRAGWRVGSAEEFLGLSSEESILVEIRLQLADSLRRHRERSGISQHGLAQRMGSSQSRIAKLESALRGTSLDLMVRALLAAGVPRREIARAFLPRRSR